MDTGCYCHSACATIVGTDVGTYSLEEVMNTLYWHSRGGIGAVSELVCVLLCDRDLVCGG